MDENPEDWLWQLSSRARSNAWDARQRPTFCASLQVVSPSEQIDASNESLASLLMLHAVSCRGDGGDGPKSATLSEQSRVMSTVQLSLSDARGSPSVEKRRLGFGTAERANLKRDTNAWSIHRRASRGASFRQRQMFNHPSSSHPPLQRAQHPPTSSS